MEHPIAHKLVVNYWRIDLVNIHISWNYPWFLGPSSVIIECHIESSNLNIVRLQCLDLMKTTQVKQIKIQTILPPKIITDMELLYQTNPGPIALEIIELKNTRGKKKKK